MADLDFNSLIASNRRESDNFINATSWCKQFGKAWSDISKQPDFKRFIGACCQKLALTKNQVIQKGSGRGAQTYVHPLIAIKLAEWLSPEFEVFAKEVLQKFIQNPEELAADILINSHNKDRVDRAKQRVLVSGTNKETMELASITGTPYAQVHNDRYRGLYRMDAKQLREDGGLEKAETPLDALSTYDLTLNSLANQRAKMMGNPNAIFSVANTLREGHEKDVGKPLAPTWEEKRLRPSQARAIAYAPEYQIELPVLN
jgi:hypothetical protein